MRRRPGSAVHARERAGEPRSARPEADSGCSPPFRTGVTQRRTLNAVIVAGVSGVYLSGGFGIWEIVYPVVATPVVYRALQSYRYVGVATTTCAATGTPAASNVALAEKRTVCCR